MRDCVWFCVYCFGLVLCYCGLIGLFVMVVSVAFGFVCFVCNCLVLGFRAC